MSTTPVSQRTDTTAIAENMTILNEIDAGRARLYALLAGLLANPPSDTLLQQLGQLVSEPLQNDPDLQHNTASLPHALQALQQCAQQRCADLVADEYQNLFIGLGKGEIVPYRSWYVTGMLMDKPLALLREDLARLGLARHEDTYESEDHAAALCEVMNLLIIHADEYTFETQKQFFINHLSWLHKFFHDMQHAPSAQFYKQVGLLGKCFIQIEQQAFAMLR
ncbi:putative component of anaerobic dehydrogenase [Beggiatoa alba B18LD]|uniref:Putative component of anaerobic dehydrogenase n=1 Tax=Beggiatoa alba B18LD TaxID=395493 RepID=I3CCR1_9GAMM|nr:molecular chaperone TorD family protein [Beggiatoa alba]EIJ41404.1 putative component of anaerobic dehydrogenase [Beggiatoa alba B18LD]